MHYVRTVKMKVLILQKMLQKFLMRVLMGMRQMENFMLRRPASRRILQLLEDRLVRVPLHVWACASRKAQRGVAPVMPAVTQLSQPDS